MKITDEHKLIVLWLLIGFALLFITSPGNVYVPYAEF